MKLSIITVNFNNRDGLQRTIDSVVSQTWRDFEWIIIDGGSTDGSKELIEQYQSHFAYWCSEPDKGIYNAMNKGIDKAKGEYLNFMNSGDCFYEVDTLEKVFSKDWAEDILYGDWMQMYDNKKQIMRFHFPIEIYSFYHHNICHQTMFVKLQLLKETNFDESYRLSADCYRWIQAAMNDASFSFVNLIVCKYDMSGHSSRDIEQLDKDWKRMRESLPKALQISLFRLDYYERTRSVRRTVQLVEKGGMAGLLTKVILKILDLLFIDIDFHYNRILYKIK